MATRSRTITPHELALEIGRRVRRIRESKKLSDGSKLSQERLAALADLSSATIQNIEYGTKVPDTLTIARVARALRVPVAEVLPLDMLGRVETDRATLDKLRRESRVA